MCVDFLLICAEGLFIRPIVDPCCSGLLRLLLYCGWGVMVVFFHLVPVFRQCRGNEELRLNDASTAVVVDVH